MKKVLLALDGSQISIGAFAFARQLHDLRPILLTGVVIPQLSREVRWRHASMETNSSFISLSDEEREEENMLKRMIDKFVNQCIDHSIPFKVHKDISDFALPALQRETRFADLLLIGGERFYQGLFNQEDSDYVWEILHTSECPVLVVPNKFRFPQINLLTYDASASSAFAIRQFAYLFPELCGQETLLLYESGESAGIIPYKAKMEELVRQHFMDVDFLKVDQSFQSYLESCTDKKKGILLVSGSCGHSFLSGLLRESFVGDLLREHQLPLFIANK